MAVEPARWQPSSDWCSTSWSAEVRKLGSISDAMRGPRASRTIPSTVAR